MEINGIRDQLSSLLNPSTPPSVDPLQQAQQQTQQQMNSGVQPPPALEQQTYTPPLQAQLDSPAPQLDSQPLTPPTPAPTPQTPTPTVAPQQRGPSMSDIYNEMWKPMEEFPGENYTGVGQAVPLQQNNLDPREKFMAQVQARQLRGGNPYGWGVDGGGGG